MASARRAALLAALVFLAVALAADPAGLASETMPGPIRAAVIEVIDGDTLEVSARIWLGHDVRIRVRLHGIDAPELRTRCAAEKEMAQRAKELLSAKVDGGAVTLTEVRYGKFAGRVMARVANAAGEDLSQAMVRAGLARLYSGGKRAPWCAD